MVGALFFVASAVSVGSEPPQTDSCSFLSAGTFSYRYTEAGKTYCCETDDTDKLDTAAELKANCYQTDSAKPENDCAVADQVNGITCCAVNSENVVECTIDSACTETECAITSEGSGEDEQDDEIVFLAKPAKKAEQVVKFEESSFLQSFDIDITFTEKCPVDNPSCGPNEKEYVAEALTYGGMIIDANDKDKHEFFYFGDGETKYSTADHAPLSYTREPYDFDSDLVLFDMKISHPLVRDYPPGSKVVFFTEEQKWRMPDRKKLSDDILSGQTTINILKNDGLYAPYVGDRIALHSEDFYKNFTVVAVEDALVLEAPVSRFGAIGASRAAATGEDKLTITLNEPIGQDLAADGTHVFVHEISLTRPPLGGENPDDDDGGGLSDAALAGIIGGSVGGVLLIAVVIRQMSNSDEESVFNGV